ncbi:Histone acetyltransferase KAT2B [Microtus ochrogaster]|uniref:Histone acetyltransferase KAT2B n=1 Tax=Microtus ochrogaster TaxID=79684 RepID=A0A8J6GYR9_MICOH|nr:Histone acetyltransferase KAT2B [Microtus ochrogaster]
MAACHSFQRALKQDHKNAQAQQEFKNANAVMEYEKIAEMDFEKRDSWKVVFCMDHALEFAPACRRFKILKAECLAMLGRYWHSLWPVTFYEWIPPMLMLWNYGAVLLKTPEEILAEDFITVSYIIGINKQEFSSFPMAFLDRHALETGTMLGYLVYMEPENHTGIPEFYLLGLSENPEIQSALFGLFLSLYLVTIFGNLLIILAIVSDPKLHTPMYLFLSNLSFSDICFTSTTVPKMLLNIQTQRKRITYVGCIAQMYFFTVFGLLDNLLLTVMAYDRFVAICHPLHYTVLMSPKLCFYLLLLAWLISILGALPESLTALRLSFCAVVEIPHYFCELPELLKLACSNTFINNVVLYIVTEEDADTKQVYFYLFKPLRKSILQRGKPVVDGSLEKKPPFEKPSIEQGVNNFVQYKFSYLPSKERQTTVELAKMFLNRINYWHLEAPSQRRLRSPNDDISGYKENYTRWLCYCNVPQFCDSLPRYETTKVFGRTLLRSVFTIMRRQLLEQARQEKDKLPLEKRTLILTHFPKFLSMLEEEVYSQNSPILDQDFLSASSRTSPLGIQTVISPPVTGTASFCTNASSHEQINGDRASPGCRGPSGLDANPGEKRKMNNSHAPEEAKRS